MKKIFIAFLALLFAANVGNSSNPSATASQEPAVYYPSPSVSNIIFGRHYWNTI